MEISTNTKQAYSEIDEFLELLSEEKRNKIPQKLRNIFKEEKDKNYTKKINPQIPIKDQKLKDETLGIIALLNLEYWTECEEEKEKLKKIYIENEKKYQEKLKKEFNTDNLFKNKNEQIKNKIVEVEKKEIAVYKEPIIKRITNKIRSLFKKREKF